MTTYGDLFTPRQLVALTTFSDLVTEAREQIRHDAIAAGMSDDNKGLEAGGTGAMAYAEAVAVYLAFVMSIRLTDLQLCPCAVGIQDEDRPESSLRTQAIPMVWDFAEANPLSEIGGGFLASSEIDRGRSRWLTGRRVFAGHATSS